MGASLRRATKGKALGTNSNVPSTKTTPQPCWPTAQCAPATYRERSQMLNILWKYFTKPLRTPETRQRYFTLGFLACMAEKNKPAFVQGAHVQDYAAGATLAKRITTRRKQNA